jgi:hypothetical protein
MNILPQNLALPKGIPFLWALVLVLFSSTATAERLESDTIENGGSIAAENVLEEVSEIQAILMDELHLALLALEIEEKSNLLSKEELDALLDSFANPRIRITATHEILTVIVPAEKRAEMSFHAEDIVDPLDETQDNKELRVTVDALNHPAKMYIKYNIQAWNNLNRCDQAVLVMHEHMGLLGIEQSLQYDLSRPISNKTSLCTTESE